MNSPNNHSRLSLLKKISSCLLFIGWIGTAGFSQEIDPNGHNKFYYEDGRLASEGFFKNGLPDGLWKTYYPDGVLKSIGNKRAGLSDSTWLFYDAQGRVTWRYEYRNDKKNGCAQRFDTLGYLSEEMYYVDDVLQGEKIWLYPNGALKKNLTFMDGKEVGVSHEFAPDGTIITVEIYDNGYLKDRAEYNRYDEKGRKTGTWREYHANGQIKSETEFRNGQKYGLTKTFNDKGKLVDIQNMTSDTTTVKDIVLIELYKEYYPDGRVRLVGGLSNGIKSGIYREYDQSGNLVNGYIYENDTMVSEGLILFDGSYDGAWKNYYKTGEQRASGQYINGSQEGQWVYFYRSGKKEQEGAYKENLPVGTWIWYYPNGQVKRRETYNARGKLEGTVMEYDSTGTELARGDYYNGVQEGSWFYHVGDHKEVGSFTVGRRDGIWNHYYKNGRLAFTGAYDEGEPKGRHVYYHTNGIKKMEGKYVGGVKEGKWRTYDKMGEITEEIVYRNGEIYKINGFRTEPADNENRAGN